MVVRLLVIGLVCAGAFVVGCGGSSNDSKSGASNAAAGQGGGPAAGGVGNNGKGGDNGGGISGASGAGTAGASGGVVGSGGENGSGGAEGGSAGATNAAGANTAGGGGGGADCRVTGCSGGLSCVPNAGVCAGAGSASCMDLQTITCVDRPVCGCDGAIYESNCAALAAGVFVGPSSLCTTPEGMFPCVDEYCDAASEYCDHRMHYGPSQYPFACNQGPAFTSGDCHPFPAGCGAEPMCNCISGEPFNGCPAPPTSCSQNDGRLTRFCPSGCYG